MTLEIILVLGGGAIGAAVVWWIVNSVRSKQTEAADFSQMQGFLAERLDRVTEQVDKRLRENARAMDESKNFLADRVSHAERSVRAVTSGLSKLEQSTDTLRRTTEEITSFQQLLKSPKIRGGFGEVLLNNLLGEVLPTDRFETQFTLTSTGEIADAVIKLQDGYIVAIDAKFPLANYEVYSTASDETVKKQARAALLRDIKKHISDISKKYVSADDKTLDYAFMYVPVESVYYETMVHDPEGESLWMFCLKNNVIPVSPNSFLAYLQTVLVGLRGMKVQQQAKEILQSITQMRQDFSRFGVDFAMIGKHLMNAKNRYDDSARKLDKFSNRLEQVDAGAGAPRIAVAAGESVANTAVIKSAEQDVEEKALVP